MTAPRITRNAHPVTIHSASSLAQGLPTLCTHLCTQLPGVTGTRRCLLSCRLSTIILLIRGRVGKERHTMVVEQGASFSAQLRRLREAAGLTQEALRERPRVT